MSNVAKLEFPEEYTVEQSNQKIKKKLSRLSQIGLKKISMHNQLIILYAT